MSAKKASRPGWNDEEDGILKEFFLSEGLDGLVKRILNRSKNAIRKRVSRLNINPDSTRSWTKDDDDFLSQNYAYKGVGYVSKQLNRSKSSIHNRAHKLNIKGSHDHCRKSASNRYTGYQEITGSYWYKLKNNASQRGLSFTISIEYVWHLYERQGRKCKLSGIPLVFSSASVISDGNASLDRIDSLKGYIEGNVQWVDKMINRMKWNLSQGDFVQRCRQVAQEHLPKPLPFCGPLHLLGSESDFKLKTPREIA